MWVLSITIILLATLTVEMTHGSCSFKNFFTDGSYGTCPYRKPGVVGLKRDSNYVTEGKCCSSQSLFRKYPITVVGVDWVTCFDKNNRFCKCPNGFFMQGYYRSHNSNKLTNIEYGLCFKPANHPFHHGTCYDQDVSSSFDGAGVSACRDGYYMTGMFRGGCDSLNCIEKFRCCQMTSVVPELQSLSDVKTRVLDVTLRDVSLLAHYLGYGWCSGCRSRYVGEDFKRKGDSLEAVYTDIAIPCSGYKSNQRLKLHYGDFKFSMKDIKFGKRIIDDLVPEIVDSGKFTNTHDKAKKIVISREINAVRRVAHTATSAWKRSHELGLEFSYTPPEKRVGVTASYKFGYENSGSTTDSTGSEQSTKFKINSDMVIPPNDSLDWQMVLSNTRSTVPYTATIVAHFSVELDGFLRWGGGYSGDSTNYHEQHRGSDDRPTFKYKFGDAQTPFYEALKKQSTEDIGPWQWSDMFVQYPSIRESVVGNLVDERWYEFTLTGTFEDIAGKHAEIKWSNGTQDEAAESAKEDPPRVFPPPPKVVISIPEYKLEKPIPINSTDPQ